MLNNILKGADENNPNNGNGNEHLIHSYGSIERESYYNSKESSSMPGCLLASVIGVFIFSYILYQFFSWIL